MTIFVLEVQGAEGWPFEDEAIAAVEAANVDEANSLLGPAVRDMNSKLFERRLPRWDEALPLVTREASPMEAEKCATRATTHGDQSFPRVVWLVDVVTASSRVGVAKREGEAINIPDDWSSAVIKEK